MYLRKVYDLKKICRLSYVTFQIVWMFFVSEKMKKSLLQNQNIIMRLKIMKKKVLLNNFISFDIL